MLLRFIRPSDVSDLEESTHRVVDTFVAAICALIGAVAGALCGTLTLTVAVLVTGCAGAT